MREVDPALYEKFMAEEYEKRGLGEYRPRPTPEQRAQRKADQERQRAEEKILALAEKAGLSVTLGVVVDGEQPERIDRLSEDEAPEDFDEAKHPW